MGMKTKIDWCDATWNPVTGCLHGCEYCYARKIAERFRGFAPEENGDWNTIQYCKDGPRLGVLNGMQARKRKDGTVVPAVYPFGFIPTIHRYRLDEPQKWKKPRNIFVCSMADLFGDWVPDEWIQEVVAACYNSLQHRYLFLTKNPARYKEVDKIVHWPSFEEMHIEKSKPTMLLGASATNDAQMKAVYDSYADWVSIEPIHEQLLPEWFVSSIGDIEVSRWEWVVIGAETGNSKNKVVPKKEWIQEIADVCKRYRTPVFMKESLRRLMDDDFIQEYPWEVRACLN